MKKFIILGLDGGSWHALDPFIQSGDLPFFKKIKEQHLGSKLRSVILPITATAWPTIFTGKNPGKHGMFDFNKIVNYEPQHYVSSADVKSKFLWEYLEEAGIKCGLINVPFSSPFRSPVSFAEGDHLRKDWINFSWPQDTTAGLDSRNPHFEQRLLDIVDLRFDQLDYVLKNKEFQFFSMNMYVHDPILHYRWNNTEFVKQAFQKIDKRLEHFVSQLDQDTTLFLISDHGMVQTKKNFHINNWLEEQGYLQLKEKITESKIAKAGFNKKNYTKIINPFISFMVKHKLMRFVSKNIRNRYRMAVAKAIPAKGKEADSLQLGKKIDWSKTKAFTLGVQGRVRLNLKGREMLGFVEEQDYETTRDQIITDLRTFFEQQQLQCEIYKREELYSGPYLKEAPDILLIIEEGDIRFSPSYRTDGALFSEVQKGKLQADHHVEGIFAAFGPINGQVSISPHIMDLTPTVLAYFGLPIPEDMDGNILQVFNQRLEEKRQTSEKERIDQELVSISL